MPYKDPEKQRAFQREWIAARRKETLAGAACVKCGSTTNLEIDHRVRKEKVSHRVWSWTKKKREEELAKCQVLCKPCHIEKTRQETMRHEHGLGCVYRRGCRCNVCRAGNAARKAQWRAKARAKGRKTT